MAVRKHKPDGTWQYSVPVFTLTNIQLAVLAHRQGTGALGQLARNLVIWTRNG